MRSDTDHTKLLYKIAKAYFEDKLTYQAIGTRFGFSRMKVARLLAQAEAEKIVQIIIAPIEDEKIELERQLEAIFGLYEAVVVQPAAYDNASISEALGPAAARALLRCLTGKEVVGLTWGRTLLSVVNALPPRNWPAMSVVQTVGGLGKFDSETYGADLVRRTAQSFRCKSFIIPAPGILRSRMACEALKSESQISGVVSLAASADILMIGIGKLTEDAYLVEEGLVTLEEFQQLKSMGAVGEILGRFFDANGCPIYHEIDSRIIGLDLDQIRSAPRVIAVAGGDKKVRAIRGALNAKLVKVLVTDDRTAVKLLTSVNGS